jgi:hypothetical protein
VDDLSAWALRLDHAADRPGRTQRICELCVEGLGINGGGISLVTTAGNRGVVCATDDVSARIEDLQFSLGEGPCVDAVRGSAPVLVPDLTDQGDGTRARWPEFVEGAVSHGVAAVFAFPLRVGVVNVGALDLYRSGPGELTRDELAGALMAADAAAVALLDIDPESGQMFAAGQGVRANYQLQVHQASGMVMAQLGGSIDDAFLILRARAFSDGTSLAEVARDVVERRIRFSRDTS